MEIYGKSNLKKAIFQDCQYLLPIFFLDFLGFELNKIVLWLSGLFYFYSGAKILIKVGFTLEKSKKFFLSPCNTVKI